MHSRRHAVAVVGYEWRAPVTTAVTGLRYSWDEVESLAVVDDNHLPYLSIPASGGAPYSAQDIDAFIVALPEKIFYPADAVDQLAPTLFKLGTLVGLPPREETLIRYFITTGSAYRRFMREHASEFDPKLVETVMSLPFAQFIWIVEFATESQWATSQVSARAVIDATASLREVMPFWLFHSRKQALVFNRESVSLDLSSSSRLGDERHGTHGIHSYGSKPAPDPNAMTFMPGCMRLALPRAKRSQRMDNKENKVFDQIEGLTAVDPEALADFKREMTEAVIPEIVRVVEERLLLAAESRYRPLEIQIVHSPERGK